MTIAGHWVHDLNPVLMPIYGQFAIRYYGLAYILGFLFAYWMLKKLSDQGRLPLSANDRSDVFTILIFSVFIGGRLGYCLFYGWQQFWQDPLFLFRVWEGGMASHGGFIGVFIGAWIVAKKYKMPYLRLIDFLAAMTPFGLMLGRIANFINGELWGKISTVPWAVIFPTSMPLGTPLNQIPPRHPSQLYEAGLEGLFLFIYTQWRLWKTKATDKPGLIAGEFVLLYGLVRIFGEQFREPDASLFIGISRGSFYSLFMILTGAVLIYLAYRQKASSRVTGQ